MLLFRLFSRKWIISTILVVIGIAVLMRLGIWQLDRLEQRRSFNARVSGQIQQPALELTPATIDEVLAAMEYRTVSVSGSYDFENQVVLRNQSWQDQYGVHLITPLHISGSDRVVMVDRGWIPAEDMDPVKWSKYDEPGMVSINGKIRRSQERPDFGRISDSPVGGGERLVAWNLVNVEQMQAQMPYELIPVYITLGVDGDPSSPPHPSEVKLDLTEGPHLGYAIQWFTFASILAIIYFLYVRREEKKLHTNGSSNMDSLNNQVQVRMAGDENVGAQQGGQL